MKSKRDYCLVKAESLESFVENQSTVCDKIEGIEIHESITSIYKFQFKQWENHDKHQQPVRRNTRPERTIMKRILAVFKRKKARICF